jgi:hypothetical protein
MTEDAEVLRSGVTLAGRHFCGAQQALRSVKSLLGVIPFSSTRKKLSMAIEQ